MNKVAASDDTRETTVICVFIDGPAVSLNGSPIVSPITAALCASEPFPPKWPASIYFLALSQSPPALLISIASNKPYKIFPVKKPPIACTPPINPTANVAIIETTPAGINFLIEPTVAIFIHLP